MASSPPLSVSAKIQLVPICERAELIGPVYELRFHIPPFEETRGLTGPRADKWVSEMFYSELPVTLYWLNQVTQLL
jgi:hypothetical protein